MNVTNNALRRSLATALSTGAVMCLTLSPLAHATGNLFAFADLQGGYLVAEKGAEGKCGEGKCGADKKTDAAGQSESETKAAEGKCGEGKCGANKKKEADATPEATSEG